MAGHSIIPISEISAGQSASIAQIHVLAIDSLLSALGPLAVERYYQIARMDTAVIGCCAVSPGGIPLGWAIGSSAPGELNGRLRAALGWRWLLASLIANPRLIWQIFISSRHASVPLKPGAVELTYIGVDLASRKQGLGRELLNAFLAQARARGFESTALSVETENAAALAIYRQAGFQAVDSIREGRYNRLRMELKL